MNAGQLPFVSVVILNCNGKRLLERCLVSVLNSNYSELEIIVVDNGSVDGSVDYINNRFGKDPRLKIISNENNLGVSEGHNVGIRNSCGEYIAFLDNDAEIYSNWFNELISVLASDPAIACVQGKILLKADEKFFDCAGGFIDYYGVSCERGNRKRNIGQFEKVTEVFYDKLSAMIVRKAVLDEIGLLDPLYFIQYDETDLCWRMWLGGHRVLYEPKAIALHDVSFTARELRLDQVYYLSKNCIASLIKNYEYKNLFKYLNGFLSLELTRAIFYFIRRDKKSLSLARAMIWNLINLEKIWTERLVVQYRVRKVSDDQIMNRVMIKPYAFPLRLLKRIVNADNR